MDNPGLAFLKQMHDPNISKLVFGKLSPLYKESLLLNPSKDKTTSFVVFFGRKEALSIERHYLLPSKINAIRRYFFTYVLLRDKFIPFYASVAKNDFDKLNTDERNYFDNKLKNYLDFHTEFVKIKGSQFLQLFRIILKRSEFKTLSTGHEFKKVRKMTRHELIGEFELFFGLSKQTSNEIDFINGNIPNIDINTERDPDVWLDSIELAPEDKRLFNLGATDSIRIDCIDAQIFGKERENPIDWIGKKHVVIILNKNLIMQKSIKLKKCIKIMFDIKASRNLTLNDCLSKLIVFI